jgi:putative cardiolipin synthase
MMISLATLWNVAAAIVVVAATIYVLFKLIYAVPKWQAPAPLEQLPKARPSDLARWLRAQCKGHPKLSGLWFLDEGRAAFAARLDLVRLAKLSIDAQYYAWHFDLTGKMLASELLAAANRGVQVRLLLDDNTTKGMDALLSGLNAHKNISVRLFNPFMMRRFRSPNYIFDFRRINRRMHNKSLTIDGVATIVGGRNIGNEYFSAHEDVQFADMDVFAVGEVVAEVVKSFSGYWNCRSAFAVDTIVNPLSDSGLDEFGNDLHALTISDIAKNYKAVLPQHSAIHQLIKSDILFDWVQTKLVVDDPAKGEGQIPRRKLLLAGLEKVLGDVRSSMDIATAYFVPGRIGMKYLVGAAGAGRRVRVLTNSLASNDVVPVHAGYARYRKHLLRKGVALYELRSSPNVEKLRRGKSKIPRFGAASSSLHAKLFTIDNQRVFIGSFNFDPRSLYLNCEMGLLIESPALAVQMAGKINELVTRRSYEPFLETFGRLSWRDRDGKIFKQEPESTLRQRIVATLISWLPVEWLL